MLTAWKMPPHTPWRMHPQGIPYIICGADGPSFGPITNAGTAAEMLAIATAMHAAPNLLFTLIGAQARLFGKGPSTDPFYREIAAAIARAEGK